MSEMKKINIPFDFSSQGDCGICGKKNLPVAEVGKNEDKYCICAGCAMEVRNIHWNMKRMVTSGHSVPN
jgi:hypothetical protein